MHKQMMSVPTQKNIKSMNVGSSQRKRTLKAVYNKK